MRTVPDKTPGTAGSDTAMMGNPFLPAELYNDAVAFYAAALERCDPEAEHVDPTANRCARSSIVAAFSFLEAQMNLAAHGHANAHRESVSQIVLDVLEEVETTVDDKGRIVRKRRRLPLTARLPFLAAFLSGREFPRDGWVWQSLLKAIELRDRQVHPKPPFIWETKPDDAKYVIDAVVAVVIEIHRLMDLEPLPWWLPADEAVTAASEKI